MRGGSIMKIRITAVTKPKTACNGRSAFFGLFSTIKLKLYLWLCQKDYPALVRKAMYYAGISAGICYLPDNFDKLLSEKFSKTFKRARGTLVSGHHSVFDHFYVSIVIEDIPKILAMVINNEKMYTTSEKSARYTKMNLESDSAANVQFLYNKWLNIFCKRIQFIDHTISDAKATRLAQENARYLTSVFTPTTMEYTTSIRQINYLRNWLFSFAKADYTPEQLLQKSFYEQLKQYALELSEKLSPFLVEGMIDNKNRSLSLFDDRESRKESFGETYSTTYNGSFAQYAQAQRHRTIHYRLRIPEKITEFYVPLCIEDVSDLRSEWLTDIGSLKEIYPQGMMVSIRESGDYEDFILKTKERLCSSAQLEISWQTYKTLQRYIQETCDNVEVHEILKKYDFPARCSAGFKCQKPCGLGSRQLDRLF